jgi:hypothetical protein
MFDTNYFLGMTGPAVQPKPKPPKVVADDVSNSKVSQGIPTLTVDEAWLLFGFPKKRATRDAVKARYLSLIVKYHPDRHIKNEAKATEYTRYINAAWVLLQRHCKW